MPRSFGEMLAAMSIENRTAVLKRGECLIGGELRRRIIELEAERAPLVARLGVLAQALWDGKLDGMAKEDLALLRMQRDVMIDYVDILDERIARLKEQG